MLNVIKNLDPAQFRPVLVLLRSRPDELKPPAGVEIIRLQRAQTRNALWALTSTIWQRRPDLVLSTLDHANVLLAFCRAFWPRKTRYVVRLTHFDSLSSAKWRALFRFSYWLADAVITQSAAMDALYREYRLPSRSVHIRNPVAVDSILASAEEAIELSPTGKQINLIAAGRLVPEKGFDLLIEALVELNRKDVHLAILGEGRMRQELEDKIASASGNSIKLLGFKDNPYPYLKASDCFILSSRSEGFPNVVLEAIACGLPVVSTPIPGIESILGDLHTAQIAREITAPALAEALSAMLSRMPLRSDRTVLVQYDAPAVAREYMQLFQNVIQAGLSGPPNSFD